MGCHAHAYMAAAVLCKRGATPTDARVYCTYVTACASPPAVAEHVNAFAVVISPVRGS